MERKEENLENKTEKRKKTGNITIKANKNGRHIMVLMNILRCIIVPFYYILKPFRFYGNRKVKDGACVYICNHYTLFDCAYVACTTWEGIHFVAKKESFDVPGLGFLMRRVKTIKVNRDGNDVRGLLDCLKCLKNGEKISIFPEGTRNRKGGDMLPFRHGAAMMAIRSKTPIVPMALYEKPRFFRCAHVLIGEPFELSEYYDRKLTEEDYSEADQKLYNKLVEMRREHAEFLKAKKKGKSK